jgi:hypothetical protein
MWEGLDAVDWAGLEHNYGSAADVPELLRRCVSPDPVDAENAASDLLNLLFHQGGWICPAASAALPFLLRVAATPGVPSRGTVLELVAMLAAEAGRVSDRFLDPGWAPAWERALPDALALLGAPEPEIRRAAADLIGSCSSPGESTLAALLRCWEADRDPATRLELVLALGQAVRRAPAGHHGDRADALLRGLLDSAEPQLRLAAVHALSAGDPHLPARRLDLVLEAIRDPSVELWRHTSSIACGVLGVQHWTVDLFPGPSPAFVLGLLADHPDDEQRIGALAQAGTLLAQWRSPTSELLPAVVARLDDPAAEVRFRAVELLACLGSSAGDHADEIAGLLGDRAARTTRVGETVGEAALWALARMNDPRCLPGLIEVLAEPRSGFGSASAMYPADPYHHVALPSHHEVLVGLRDHADVLVPAVCKHLGVATDAGLLNQHCQTLAAWGPAAREAVPRLVGLLKHDRTWIPAATALAGIGTADDKARTLLLSRSTAGGRDAPLAAWAYWKTGGDPGPALEVLGPATTGRFPHPALRKLADLGPHAAGHADQLRTMTTATDPWTRVEAAHALWAATGDTDHVVPALLTAVQDLAHGRYQPVQLAAVRYLTRIGRPSQPAARLLRGIPLLDQRLRSNGGWRGFTQDETIRAAVHDLHAATADGAT